MALFEYSYARKLYYPLLSLMWICRYGVFASSVRLIHFLSHSCCTLRYHWHNTRTKSSIHLFIEIIAYAMYFQWCAHSVALNSMRMRVCIDMWTKCTRMVLIMAVSWQEVRRCTHTHSPQAPNRFKTHWTLAMFLFLGRFLWPKIGCSAFVGWILKVAGGERWRVSILCRGCSLVFVVMFAHWMLKWPIYMP